jgi:hypothetical protein
VPKGDKDIRYLCPICGRYISHWPVYVHVLVWHRTTSQPPKEN